VNAQKRDDPRRAEGFANRQELLRNGCLWGNWKLDLMDGLFSGARIDVSVSVYDTESLSKDDLDFVLWLVDKLARHGAERTYKPVNA
jgi:hypothetical protein